MTEEREEYQALPEAPASVNVRFYYHRFDVQLTIRDHKAGDLWDKLTWLIEKKLIPNPAVQPKFGNSEPSSPKPKAEARPLKEPTDGQPAKAEEPPPSIIECPEHKVEMKLQDGKWGPFYSHPIGEDKWCNIKLEKAKKEKLI